MSSMTSRANFYDLQRLFFFREILERLDPASSSRAFLVEPEQGGNPDRVGILPGSFNPPTLAHVELALEAKKAFKLDSVILAISRVTIDKEEIEGLCLEDRLLILSLIARELGWVSLAATNRGLYYEQANALRALLGRKAKIYFLVGMDKVMQILDPRYYENRETALLAFFTEAQLVAANRGSLREEGLREMLGSPENENFKDRIYYLPLADETAEISSSALRDKIQRGEAFESRVPESVAAFVAETGAYRNAYEYRSRLLDLLHRIRREKAEQVDFRKLVTMASEQTEAGEKLRALLSSSKTTPGNLEDFLALLK